MCFFFFNDTATTEIYTYLHTLSLHDALPIFEHDPPEKVERLGWGKIVTKREAWAFAMAKFLTEPVWFLMLFWLPKYFSTTYNVDLKIILLPMIIMYLMSDAGSILGGWASSKLIQPGHSVNFRWEEQTSELQSPMRS